MPKPAEHATALSDAKGLLDGSREGLSNHWSLAECYVEAHRQWEAHEDIARERAEECKRLREALIAVGLRPTTVDLIERGEEP